MGDYHPLETFTFATLLSFKFHTENPNVDEWLFSCLTLWMEDK